MKLSLYNKIINSISKGLYESGLFDNNDDLFDNNDELTLDELNIAEKLNSYELVDLGLPSGTLWMDRNIGAKHPEDPGEYYGWGEIYSKQENRRGLYKVDVEDKNSFQDVVKYKTNGKCRMPKEKDVHELINNTKITQKCINYTNVYVFTSKNGNSIIIPCCGYKKVDKIENGFNGYLYTTDTGEYTTYKYTPRKICTYGIGPTYFEFRFNYLKNDYKIYPHINSAPWRGMCARGIK